MITIQATVTRRLLTKASRLFTGTLEGRIIEILQNARRAGATRVEITNQDGRSPCATTGSGIDDFAKLLDLGGSGWDEASKPAKTRPASGCSAWRAAGDHPLQRPDGHIARTAGPARRWK